MKIRKLLLKNWMNFKSFDSGELTDRVFVIARWRELTSSISRTASYLRGFGGAFRCCDKPLYRRRSCAAAPA